MYYINEIMSLKFFFLYLEVKYKTNVALYINLLKSSHYQLTNDHRCVSWPTYIFSSTGDYRNQVYNFKISFLLTTLQSLLYRSHWTPNMTRRKLKSEDWEETELKQEHRQYAYELAGIYNHDAACTDDK